MKQNVAPRRPLSGSVVPAGMSSPLRGQKMNDHGDDLANMPAIGDQANGQVHQVLWNYCRPRTSWQNGILNEEYLVGR
jgi:hypothetical protein